ncbi:antibiotic resistance protein VanZ [Leucobacter chromiiresistens]|uniref:Antibiotic resistance protein VanZ n=2 Tax=Leucobacter chromiiresistens TaxID=1079994 RepID=A0A147EP78_9MICO|nr:antibiotic resistance protein VanZ [Leucobacter chromiiresistens]
MKIIEVPMLPIVIPLGIVTFLVLLRVLRSRGRITLARASVAAALAIYAGGVLANTVFPILLRDGPGFHDGPRPIPLYLVPFVDYEFQDALINIAVFIPLGGLIPLLAARARWWEVLAIVAGASLAIELAQLVTARIVLGGHLADVNDWLTNILGGMIGFGLFALLTRSTRGAAFVDRFRWPARQDRLTTGTVADPTPIPASQNQHQTHPAESTQRVTSRNAPPAP